MFEIYTGFLPFGDNEEDPYAVYKEILNNELDHEELKELIKNEKA